MERNEAVELAEVRELTASGAARALRVGNRLSLSDVASAVGVAVSTVWRWEAGQRTPRGEPALRYGALLRRLAGRRSWHV